MCAGSARAANTPSYRMAEEQASMHTVQSQSANVTLYEEMFPTPSEPRMQAAPNDEVLPGFIM